MIDMSKEHLIAKLDGFTGLKLADDMYMVTVWDDDGFNCEIMTAAEIIARGGTIE